MIQPGSSRIITVFGSRYPQPGDTDYEAAFHLGTLLAEGGYAVCTGGYSGIMEATSKGARQRNGHTIGVTVKTFVGNPNPYLIEEIRADNLFLRLQKLISLGSAYVVFRGGMGTIAELCLVWNLVQMGQLDQDRLIFLFGKTWISLLENWKLTSDVALKDYDLLRVVNDPEEILKALKRVA